MSRIGQTTSDVPFVEHAQAVVYGVRRAMGELLASVGADPSEPQEVSRQFGIDKTLAWKIARVIREPDPWNSVAHIPRRPSILILVAALAKAGAAAGPIEDLLAAIDRFETFVELHSDDRETLEIMIGSSTKVAGAAKRLDAFRRSAYQSNSAIWGVRAKLQICIHVLAPEGDSLLSKATITGFHGFNRLRPDVPWSVATLAHWDVGATESRESADSIVPMAPGLDGVDVPILSEFCSEPLPGMRSVRLANGQTRFEINRGPVGNTAAATVILGWVSKGTVSRYETYPGEHGEHGVFMSTPAETMVHDLLVHRSLKFAHNPTAHVFSELPGGPRYLTDGEAAGTIPFHEKVLDLGAGPPDLTTPEFPRYRDLAALGTRSLGFELSDFQGYRVRLAHPPIPTLAILRHGLTPPSA